MLIIVTITCQDFKFKGERKHNILTPTYMIIKINMYLISSAYDNQHYEGKSVPETSIPKLFQCWAVLCTLL